MTQHHALRKLPHAGILLLLLLFSTAYYSGVLLRLPFGMHEWAQADRLSLAFNFYDRGMNFFLPATYNLSSVDGITGVECPLQAYIAAALAHIFGRSSISPVFRLLDIGIAVTGLYFLFRAVWDATRDFVFSMVPPLFIFCSPVYVYYSGNYLPDPAAASIVFIAFYFLLRYLSGGRLKALIVAIAIATLAVLIKSSAYPYLGGIVFAGLYKELYVSKDRRALRNILYVSAGAAILLLMNLLHIRHLNTTYGGKLFLAEPMPFGSLKEFIAFATGPFLLQWLQEYFVYAQYSVYFLLLTMAAVLFAKGKALRTLLLPVTPFLVLAIGVFLLFGSQYYQHDYYFLATWMPLVAYCLVIALIALHHYAATQLTMWRAGLGVTILITFAFCTVQAHERVHQLGVYREDYPTIRWLGGGAAMLDSLGIPKDERIVVPDMRPPNVALLYFDRRGYVLERGVWEAAGLAGISRLMKAKSLSILVLEDTVLRRRQDAGDAGLGLFSVVAVSGHKVVCRLMPH